MVDGSSRASRLLARSSIQGSLRSLKSPLGPEYDVDDAQAVWTLEENLLQRSGLPREFDFVLLVHKPGDIQNIYLSVDVDAVVGTWFGDYPQWYANLSKYQPTQDLAFDFNTEIGQKFLPSDPDRGFNFAGLPYPLVDYVQMPGTIYPTNDSDTSRSPGHSGRTFDRYPERDGVPAGHFLAGDSRFIEASPLPLDGSFPSTRYDAASRQPVAQSRQSWAPDTNSFNVRVLLEHGSPRPDSARRYSPSPHSFREPMRTQSIRRKRSRSELKEYGARQALYEVARGAMKERDEDSPPRLNRTNGSLGAKQREPRVNSHP